MSLQSAGQEVPHLKVTGKFEPQGLVLHKDAFTEHLTAATKTVDVQDSGKVFLCSITTVITLPAVGDTFGPFTFVNYGDDGVVQISVDPNASDLLYGPDISAATDKDYVNTLATAERGDQVTVTYANSSGWRLENIIGTWAIES